MPEYRIQPDRIMQVNKDSDWTVKQKGYNLRVFDIPACAHLSCLS